MLANRYDLPIIGLFHAICTRMPKYFRISTRPVYAVLVVCLGDPIQYEGSDVGCSNLRRSTMEFNH
jgi:hypothetical protein